MSATYTPSTLYVPSPAPPPAPPAVKITTAVIGLIISLAVQSAGIVWWASGMDRRVSALETANPPGAVARIDERTTGMRDDLKLIQRRLDNMGNHK